MHKANRFSEGRDRRKNNKLPASAPFSTFYDPPRSLSQTDDQEDEAKLIVSLDSEGTNKEKVIHRNFIKRLIRHTIHGS